MSADIQVRFRLETPSSLIPASAALTTSHARPEDQHLTCPMAQASKIDGTNDEDVQGIMPVGAQPQPIFNPPSTLYFHLPRPPPLHSDLDTQQSPRYCSRLLPKIRTVGYSLALPPTSDSSSSPSALASIGVAVGSPSDVTFRYTACEQNMSFKALPQRPDKLQRYYQVHPTTVSEPPTHHRKKSSWKALAFWKAGKRSDDDSTQNSGVKQKETIQCPPSTPINPPIVPRGITRLEKRMAAERQAIKQTYQSRAGLSPARRRLDMRATSSQLLQASGNPTTQGSGPNYGSHDIPLILEKVLTAPPAPKENSPKLELDIPDARLDRYSIMFEQLLRPPTQPSLLERRQRRSLVLNTTTTHQSAEPQPEFNKSNHRATMPPLTTPIQPAVSPLTARLETVMSAPDAPVSPLTMTSIEGGSETAEQTPKPVRPSLQDRAVTEPLPMLQTQLDDAHAHMHLDDRSSSSPSSSALIRDGTPHSDCPGEDDDNYLSPDTPATDTSEVISIHDGTFDDMERGTHLTSSQQLKLFPTPSDHTPRYRDHRELEKHMVEVSVARQVSVSLARQTVHQAMLAGRQPLQRPKMVELSGHKHAAKKSQSALMEFN